MIPNDPAYRHARRLRRPEIGLGLGVALGGGQSGFPLSGATIDADFANGRYFGTDAAGTLAWSRASVRTDLFYDSPAGYSYTTFPANTACIVPGRGLNAEESSTNLVASPTAPANQTITLTATGLHCLWIRSSDSTGAATVAGGTAVITPYKGAQAVQGSYMLFFCAVTGTVNLSVTGTVEIAQLEAKGFPTSFIDGARSADSALAGSAIVTLLNSEDRTIYVRSQATVGSTIGSARYFSPIAPKQNSEPGSLFNSASNGTDPLFYVPGSGNALDDVINMTAWSASGRSFCANGGVVGTSSLSAKQTTITSVRYGQGSTTTENLNGWTKRLVIWSSRLSDAGIKALSSSVPSYGQALYGDSLSVRMSANMYVYDPKPRTVSERLTRNAQAFPCWNGAVDGGNMSHALVNNGVFGNNAAPVTIWLGTNYRAGDTADLATLIGRLTTSKYVICRGLNADNANGESGGSTYANISAQWATYVSTYPGHTLDLSAALIAASSGSAHDLYCVGRDVTPPSLRTVTRIGAPAAAIDASQTSFTSISTNGSGGLVSGQVIQLDDELIQITSTSSGSPTACVRGFNGTTAAAHAAGTIWRTYDPVHINDAGRDTVEAAIYAKQVALGFFS